MRLFYLSISAIVLCLNKIDMKNKSNQPSINRYDERQQQQQHQWMIQLTALFYASPNHNEKQIGLLAIHDSELFLSSFLYTYVKYMKEQNEMFEMSFVMQK